MSEIDDAFSAARRLFRDAAPDLVFPTFFLPREKRRAVDAVAAFCAMIVDALKLPEHSLAGARAMREHPVVRTSIPLAQLPAENAAMDSADACDGDTTSSRLGMLAARVDEIYDGTLELPAPASRSPQQQALLALAETVKKFPIERKQFMDFACSSSVLRAEWLGRIIVSVLGAQSSDMQRYVTNLATGIALARKADQKDFAMSCLHQGAEGICWLADDGSRLAVSIATVTAASRLRKGTTSRLQTILLIPRALRLARRMDGELVPEF